MNLTDLKNAAWVLLLDGAESMAEDWIDEDDTFGDNADLVFSYQMVYLDLLRKQGPPEIRLRT